MKHPLIRIFLCFLTYPVSAQNFTAKYNVIKDIVSNGSKSHVVATLKFDGYYYRKNMAIISYLKPLYLAEYPIGFVMDKESDLNFQSYNLEMDTIQSITYCQLDSMLLRYRFGIRGNFVNLFETGIHQWKIYPGPRTIQGLTCQRAVLSLPNGTPYCDMWFATEIPMPIGFRTLLDMPGLMVEGEFLTLHEKYFLQRYSFEDTINNSLFWPREFEEPFKQQDKFISRKNNQPVTPAKPQQ